MNMKNSQKGITPIIIAIVIALAIGGGGYYYVHNQNIKIGTTKVAKNSTYTFSGFTFVLPANATLKEEQIDNPRIDSGYHDMAVIKIPVSVENNTIEDTSLFFYTQGHGGNKICSDDKSDIIKIAGKNFFVSDTEINNQIFGQKSYVSETPIKNMCLVLLINVKAKEYSTEEKMNISTSTIESQIKQEIKSAIPIIENAR
jgi:hypothetical protein